ncbi:hypothetical protein [Caloranaerobacter azorensis]|uniref:Uncharacterized protein n=2 Tax=Caloranaerobacter azorensis TaxID=116090 RepID=A0A096CXG2_9FIRM|nr:hypothetical protein [Caloranaerobacter azorensis]KGG81269.1 hypothetical protein Y919_01180 [Caloranaerobacter azorensis H53214]QIB27919.1 hypothetical protein G3A45_11945 [Caloranaerobacter azorensis]
MFRKVLTGALIIAIIGTYGTVGYSAGDDVEIKNSNTNVEKAEEESIINVIYPEDNLITTDNIVLLSGRAKKGLKIIIEVYSSTGLLDVDFDVDISSTKNDGNEKNDSDIEEVKEIENTEATEEVQTKETKESEDTYTLESKEVLEVGELGVFAKELELKQGKNKINIYVIDDEDEETEIITKYVYVTDIEKVKEYIDKLENMNFSETIKKMIDSSNNQDTSTELWR